MLSSIHSATRTRQVVYKKGARASAAVRWRSWLSAVSTAASAAAAAAAAAGVRRNIIRAETRFGTGTGIAAGLVAVAARAEIHKT